jgi:PAS domain S-box-containing protein
MSVPTRRRTTHVRPSAVKAALAYLLVAVLWVYGTDELVALLSVNARSLIILEKVKGVLFVVFTAASLYFLLRRHERLLGVAAEHQAESVLSATAALQQSEEKNRLLVEQAADGIVVLDAVGKVEQINEKALKILRLTLEQASGLRYGDIVPDEDQATDPLSMMSMPVGEEIRRDRRFRLPDGSEMLAEISARRLQDGRFLAIFRDVTERRNAEEALRISEERFRTVFQQAPDVIFEIGADGKFVSLNPAFETITGWRIDEWIGRDMLDVIAPESRELAQETFERHVVEHQQVAPRQEYGLVTKSGKSVLLEVNSAINLVDGGVQQVFGFGRDVTEDRQRDLERSRLQTLLEQSERVSGLGRVARYHRS